MQFLKRVVRGFNNDNNREHVRRTLEINPT